MHPSEVYGRDDVSTQDKDEAYRQYIQGIVGDERAKTLDFEPILQEFRNRDNVASTLKHPVFGPIARTLLSAEETAGVPAKKLTEFLGGGEQAQGIAQSLSGGLAVKLPIALGTGAAVGRFAGPQAGVYSAGSVLAFIDALEEMATRGRPNVAAVYAAGDIAAPGLGTLAGAPFKQIVTEGGKAVSRGTLKSVIAEAIGQSTVDVPTSFYGAKTSQERAASLASVITLQAGGSFLHARGIARDVNVRNREIEESHTILSESRDRLLAAESELSKTPKTDQTRIRDLQAEINSLVGTINSTAESLTGKGIPNDPTIQYIRENRKLSDYEKALRDPAAFLLREGKFQDLTEALDFFEQKAGPRPTQTEAATPSVIKKSGRDFLSKVEKGGVPKTLTKKLRGIAEEHGIQLQDTDTPEVLVTKLKAITEGIDDIGLVRVQAQLLARAGVPSEVIGAFRLHPSVEADNLLRKVAHHVQRNELSLDEGAALVKEAFDKTGLRPKQPVASSIKLIPEPVRSVTEADQALASALPDEADLYGVEKPPPPPSVSRKPATKQEKVLSSLLKKSKKGSGKAPVEKGAPIPEEKVPKPLKKSNVKALQAFRRVEKAQEGLSSLIDEHVRNRTKNIQDPTLVDEALDGIREGIGEAVIADPSLLKSANKGKLVATIQRQISSRLTDAARKAKTKLRGKTVPLETPERKLDVSKRGTPPGEAVFKEDAATAKLVEQLDNEYRQAVSDGPAAIAKFLKKYKNNKKLAALLSERLRPLPGTTELKRGRGARKFSSESVINHLENKVAEFIFQTFGYRIHYVHADTLASFVTRQFDIGKGRHPEGMVDHRAKAIFLAQGKGMNTFQTLRHELGHIVFDKRLAPKILAQFSNDHLAHLAEQYGVTNRLELASEIHAEAFSRLLGYEFEKMSAPMLRRTLMSLSSVLEAFGINVIKAVEDRGYVTDLPISGTLRGLLRTAVDATKHLSNVEPNLAYILGNTDKMIELRTTPYKDDGFLTPLARSDKPTHEKLTEAFFNAVDPTKRVDNMIHALKQAGVWDGSIDSMMTQLQQLDGRAYTAASDILDPVRQVNRELIDSGNDAHFSAWYKYKRLQNMLTLPVPQGKKGFKAPVDSGGTTLDIAEVTKRIAGIERKLKQVVVNSFLKKYAPAVEGAYDALLKLQLDEHLITKALYEKIRASGTQKFFTPFRYDQSEVRSGSRKKNFGEIAEEAFVREIEGGAQGVSISEGVFESVARHAVTVERAVHENRVMRQFTGLTLARNTIKGLIKNPTTPKARLPELQALRDGIDALVRLGKKKTAAPLGFVERDVLIKGKPQRYYVSEEMAHAMNYMTPDEMGGFMRAISSPAMMTRLFSVYFNPTFGLRQLFRDASNAMLANPGGYIGGKRQHMGLLNFVSVFPSAIAETARNLYYRNIKLDTARLGNDDFALARREGAFSGTRFEEHKTLWQRFRKKKGVLKLVPNKFDRFVKSVLAFPTELSELGVRLAVFKAMRKQGFDVETSGVGAKSILDMSQMGYVTRQVNMVIPFTASRIQGTAVLWRSLQHLNPWNKSTPAQRAGAMMKLTAGAILTQASIMASQVAYAAFTGKKEEALQANDSMWQREWSWPITRIHDPANPEEWSVLYATLPKPDLLQPLWNPMEAIVRDALKKDLSGDTASNVVRAFVESVIPINVANEVDNPTIQAMAVVSQFFGPLGTATGQVLANQEFYSGQRIVPEGLRDMNPEDQYRATTPKVVRSLTDLVNPAVPISPAQLHSFLKSAGLGGDVYQTLAKTPDLLLPKTDEDRLVPKELQGTLGILSELAITKGFVKRGGFKDARDELSSSETEGAIRAINSTKARFERKLSVATQTAAATGTLEPLESLLKVYGNDPQLRDRLREAAIDVRRNRGRMDRALASLPVKVRAIEILNMESKLSGEDVALMYAHLKRKGVLTKDTAYFIRKYKEHLLRSEGKTLDDVAEAIQSQPSLIELSARKSGATSF